MTGVLAENYYLKNFDALVQFVARTYDEILTPDELNWAHTVQTLPNPARQLYVRLLSRKGVVFRIGKLKYPEIPDLLAAAQRLEKASLAHLNVPTELTEVLAVVTRPELMRLPELNDMKRASRAALDDRLLELNSPDVLQSLGALDQWISIASGEIFERYVLCYFGNPYQDLSDFVLRDLGHFRYESYRIDKNTRPFQTREQLDAHWQTFQCQAMLELVDSSNADEILAVANALVQPESNHLLKHDVHLLRRVGRLNNQVARQLERLQENKRALTVYRRSDLPPSRERQVRLLSASGKQEDALKLALSMQNQPIDDSELRFAVRQVPALRRALGQRVNKLRPFRPMTTRLTLQPDTAECEDDSPAEKVEWLAVEYYQRAGRCYYVENTLVRSVLGLFIWDLMYLPIDGAFHHPFQSGPSDLMQAEFVARRQGQFLDRWEEFNEPLRFSARVWQHYEEKQGISNTLVHWSYLSEALLTDALIRIPVEHWQAIFERLLADLRHNGKGLPDLVLFPHDGGYEFIEIKGPGDALQQHQRRWMQYFTEHQIPNRVVHIRYAMTESDG